jgi:cell wall-associated NlpC family hydrolase
MTTPIQIIDKYEGIKFVKNGRDPNIGLDCWGLCLCIVEDIFGVTDLPDPQYSILRLLRQKISLIKQYDMAYWTTPVKGNLAFGDYIVINIRGITMHGGIYMEDNKFLHAVAGKGMLLADLNDWKKNVEGIYRLKKEHIKKTE